MFGFTFTKANHCMKITKTRLLRLTIVKFMILALGPGAFAESALMGWQTSRVDGSYESRVYMLGPTQRNKMPERKGEFKGEFYTRQGEGKSELVSIYKLS